MSLSFRRAVSCSFTIITARRAYRIVFESGIGGQQIKGEKCLCSRVQQKRAKETFYTSKSDDSVNKGAAFR